MRTLIEVILAGVVVASLYEVGRAAYRWMGTELDLMADAINRPEDNS